MQIVSVALQLKELILNIITPPAIHFMLFGNTCMQDQTTGITLTAHGNWFSSNGTQFQLLIISASSRLSANSDLALHTEIL